MSGGIYWKYNDGCEAGTRSNIKSIQNHIFYDTTEILLAC